MIIMIENIKNFVDKKIYEQGVIYHDQGMVELKRIELHEFEAIVNEDISYQVKVIEKKGDIYSSCSCHNLTTCSHIIAALLTARKHYVRNRANMIYKKSHPHWHDFFSKIIAQQKPLLAVQPQISRHRRLLYLIKLHPEYWILSLNKAFIKSDGKPDHLSGLESFDLNNENIVPGPDDQIIIAYLKHLSQQHNAAMSRSYHIENLKATEIPLPYGTDIGSLLDLLKQNILFLTKDPGMIRIKYVNEPVQLEFKLIEHEKDYQFLPMVYLQDREEQLNSRYRILTENPIWLLRGKHLLKATNPVKTKLLVPFTKDNIYLSIPREEFPYFIQTSYSDLSMLTTLPLPAGYQVTTVSEITTKRLYLNESTKKLELVLRLVYDDVEINGADFQTTFYKIDPETTTLKQIKRDLKLEQEIWQKLEATGLESSATGCFSIEETRAFDWIIKFIPYLIREKFEIFGEEKLKKYRILTVTPNVRLSIATGIDWFDLDLQIDINGVMISVAELKNSMSFNSRYIKLADGSTARLPENWYKKFAHLLNFASIKDNVIRLSKLHFTLVDELTELAVSGEIDQEFRETISRFKDFNKIEEQELPANIVGNLRAYQKAGYNWFYFLQEFSFGGCLADDMGLGKTLQALTLLLKEKEKGKITPSLIICPTSVVFNWDREVQKFTPDLTVLRHSGIDRPRTTLHFSNYDIILTSYGVMRRDISFLKDFRFHYVILDESQYIKNPVSQTAKAARLLNAEYRLVLTGTPVENNTMELWSQFAFLNPGLLGSLPFFKREFAVPIEKRKSEDTAEYLKKLIYPFILRRSKESVARELPPKIEQTYFCLMSPEQKKLYHRWRDYYRTRVLGRIEEIGLDRARFSILEGLLKLRLIASHPQLVDATIWEDSGKFKMLKEFVGNILAENHKILIFSQFVKMLKLIRKYFDDNHFIYEYLDGHTRDREKCVQSFQTDDKIKIFLISLKAGGTGLNLTAADYVLHFDPWWNPAVEIQATDRAHRIGQDKKVFVYRFITKDSVEEKVLELQQQKKELVSNLITTDSKFFKSLTKKDIEILFT